MANILQLINKSQTLEDKARRMAEDVLYDAKRKNISSTPEVLYRVYLCMKEFYESIGKPSMKLRKALDAPSSADYNNTFKEIKNDILSIHEECVNLESILEQIYSQMEMDQLAIGNMITNCYKNAEKAQFRIDNINCTNVFIDSFTSKNYFNSEACNDTPAFINTAYQYLSLATTSFKNVNAKAQIKILDGSNGFPGNTHQIKLVDNDIKFYGEENPRLNLADALDENSDTWFEYEAYKVSDEILLDTLGLGFGYDEAISWLLNGNQLELTVAMTFKKAELVNTFSISPYIAPEKGASPCLIESIVISDGRGSVREIVSSPELFDDSKVYSFPKQYCKEITITFSQEIAYKTTIGHTYYKEVPHSNIDYYKTHEATHNKRVDGPLPSVSNVGITYDSTERRFIQPTFNYGDTIQNESIIKSELFDLKDDEALKNAYQEALIAERYLVGIRDMSLSSYAYESSSEYVSNNFETSKPITAISMEASEFIPEKFGTDKDWITYYFSLNDGADWHPIVPKGLYKKEGYSRYLINSGTPAEFRDSNIGYIETPDDNHAIQVKIEISRPTGMTDIEYYTPVVYEYKLEL